MYNTLYQYMYMLHNHIHDDIIQYHHMILPKILSKFRNIYNGGDNKMNNEMIESSAVKYCHKDSFDMLKRPEFADIFKDEFFNNADTIFNVITNNKYFDLANAIAYELRGHITSKSIQKYRQQDMDFVENEISKFLHKMYQSNIILDYGMMLAALNHISNGRLYFARDVFIKTYGFWIINRQNINNLKEFIGNSKVLEIMAGTGYVGKLLKDQDIDIISIDDGSWSDTFDEIHYRTENIDCLDAIRKYGNDCDVLLMSWVPLRSDIGGESMKLYHEINPKGAIIWIGEDEGGCTGSDMDFEVMDEIGRSSELEDIFNCNFERFNGIHDEAFIMDPTGKRKMTQYVTTA